VLDLNTAGWRTGLATPYPAPWLVRRACETEVAFCFGDDSHGPRQTGAGVVEARAYLLENGVESIRRLTREDGRPVWQTVDL
jgi:histidinol phosphatase-like PHP family hydrolase